MGNSSVLVCKMLSIKGPWFIMGLIYQRHLAIKFRRYWPSSTACLWNFQLLGAYTSLTSIFHTEAKGVVDPSASPCCGNGHRRQRLRWQGHHDSTANLTCLLLWNVGLTSTRISVRGTWSYYWSPFCGYHLGTRTSKQKTLWGTNLETQVWYPTRAFRAHEGGLNGVLSSRRCHKVSKRGILPMILHPIVAHQWGPMGRNL